MNKNVRFYEIDLARFIAAFVVVIFHYAFRGAAADNYTEFSYPWLSGFAQYGYLGVDLFFMISGFVILMTASSGSTKGFVISRIVRLYPAFWVCCTLTFLVGVFASQEQFSFSFSQYIVNLTMLSGFVGVRSIDGAYWSLFVEIRFYVMVFIVLLLGKIHHASYLLGAWLFACLLSMFFGMGIINHILMTNYAPYFISGAMFFIVCKEGWSLYKASIIFTSYILVVINSSNKIFYMIHKYNVDYSLLVISVILLVFYLFFIALSFRLKILVDSDRAKKTYVFLGALTYPLYLIHQNIGYMVFNQFHKIINPHVLIWGMFLLAVLLAYLVHRYIERIYAPKLKIILQRLLKVER